MLGQMQQALALMLFNQPVGLLKLRGSDMARQLMQKCKKCGVYLLTRECQECDGIAQAAAPMKWSPEDKHAHIRRKIEGVEEDGWSEKLPTLAPKEEE